MKRLLECLTKDWNGFRIFRAVLGIGVGTYAVVTGDSFLLMLAAFVLIQALLNASCCCGGSCGSDADTKKELYKDEIETYKPLKK